MRVYRIHRLVAEEDLYTLEDGVLCWVVCGGQCGRGKAKRNGQGWSLDGISITVGKTCVYLSKLGRILSAIWEGKLVVGKDIDMQRPGMDK